MIAGLLFYVTAIGCLYFLVVKQATTIRQAVIMGCVAGLFSYGTYALTGQALFKNWRWLLTVLDIAGVFFFAGYYLRRRFFRQITTLNIRLSESCWDCFPPCRRFFSFVSFQ